MTQAQSSSYDLAEKMNWPERVLCNKVDPSFRTTFLRIESMAQEPIKTLEAALSSGDKGPPSIQKYGMKLTPESISQILNRLQLQKQNPWQTHSKAACVLWTNL